MIKPAKEGATYSFGYGTQVVAASCDLNRGQWLCLTDMMMFPNNIQKDHHCAAGDESKDHVLAWMCIEHGAEVP